MDKQQAARATSYGAVAALVGLGYGAALEYAGLLDELESVGMTATVVIYLLYLGLTWAMWRKSRMAALVMLVLTVSGEIVMRLEVGHVLGVWGALISLSILSFLAFGVKGAFVWHRLARSAGQGSRLANGWVIAGALPVFFLFAGVVALSFGAAIGVTPQPYVQPGDELKSRTTELLLEHDIIEQEDEIELFYSEGFLSILDGGQLLVQDRVISYLRGGDDEIEVYEIYYSEVTSIEVLIEGWALEDALYKIVEDEEDVWIMIYLSTEKDGHKRFIDALIAHTGAPLVNKREEWAAKPGD